MQINPYLTFKGDCEAAFKFYEQCFGAQLGPMFRYEGSPMADRVSDDWSDKIMHGSFTVGGQTLMGADMKPEEYEPPRGIALSLQIRNIPEAERIYTELAGKGEVVMALEKTFWAARFGVVVDQFGIRWLINCEETDESSE